MPIATARFATPNAGRLLDQLAKHFAHKIAVEQAGDVTRFALPPGPAEGRADAEGLTLEARGETPEALARGQQILEDHLLRFAFREEPAPLDWAQQPG